MKLEACVAEVGFDGAFGLFETGGDVFDGQFLKVVEAKDLFADGGELLDGSAEMFSEFLIHDVLTRGGVCFCDTAFIDGVQRVEVLFLVLFSEVIYTHIFGDTVEP